jgi:monothiol glutaredoxin
LYIDGELVGGCDIVTEMFEKGELQPLVESAGAEQSEE